MILNEKTALKMKTINSDALDAAVLAYMGSLLALSPMYEFLNWFEVIVIPSQMIVQAVKENRRRGRWLTLSIRRALMIA